MKRTMKHLLSAVMAMAMLTTLFFPASASEIEPYVGDRFKYYTVKTPWETTGSFNVTATDSKQYTFIENKIFGIMGARLPDVFFPDASVSLVQKFIRNNNWDNIDVGTYTIESRDIIHYREHLLTGKVDIELRQVEFVISFQAADSSSGNPPHHITVTVDH